MAFIESDNTISDSNNVSFLNKVGVISFEEGPGRGSLVGDGTIDHRNLETVTSFNDSWLDVNDFNIDVVAVAKILKILNFGEPGFG